jgi:HAD superfamily hydrolase (TIGR01490 family)
MAEVLRSLAVMNADRHLVIFDLDGTLIKQQSQRLFLSHLRRTGHIGLAPFVKLLLWFVCYRMGFVKEPEHVMKYAFSFLNGRDAKEFFQIAESFADEVIVPAVSAVALRLIREHHENGDELLLVSNSLEPVVGQVARSLGIGNHIATRLEAHQGRYTGNLEGSAVYGHAKADVIRDFVVSRGLSLANSTAYCDHDSDLPVLEMVARPVAVNAVPRLLDVAKVKGWQILSL